MESATDDAQKAASGTRARIAREPVALRLWAKRSRRMTQTRPGGADHGRVALCCPPCAADPALPQIIDAWTGRSWRVSPEGLHHGPVVQGGCPALAPVHEGRDILPALQRHLPVVGHPGRGLVDLVQHEHRVPGWWRVRVRRILQLRPLRDPVRQQRLVTLTRMSRHPPRMAFEDAVALGHVVRADDPHDADVGLACVGHGCSSSVLSRTRIAGGGQDGELRGRGGCNRVSARLDRAASRRCGRSHPRTGLGSWVGDAPRDRRRATGPKGAQSEEQATRPHTPWRRCRRVSALGQYGRGAGASAEAPRRERCSQVGRSGTSRRPGGQRLGAPRGSSWCGAPLRAAYVREYPWRDVLRPIAAILLVLVVVLAEPTLAPRLPRPLTYLGDASYSLYLFHPLVAPAVPVAL